MPDARPVGEVDIELVRRLTCDLDLPRATRHARRDRRGLRLDLQLYPTSIGTQGFRSAGDSIHADRLTDAFGGAFGVVVPGAAGDGDGQEKDRVPHACEGTPKSLSAQDKEMAKGDGF